MHYVILYHTYKNESLKKNCSHYFAKMKKKQFFFSSIANICAQNSLKFFLCMLETFVSQKHDIYKLNSIELITVKYLLPYLE